MIKNIIFDLGGVLIDLNVKDTFDCFGGNFAKFYNKKLPEEFEKLVDDFNRGDISADTFRSQTMDIFSLMVSKAKFDNCWNAMVGDMHTDTIRTLIELKKKFKIFLLSNINEIHYDYLLTKDYWEPALFEKCYFSHLMGMIKPEKKIYQYVLSKNNLNTEETFYIDDSKKNVISASKLGINAYHYNGQEKIADLLQQLFKLTLPPII